MRRLGVSLLLGVVVMAGQAGVAMATTITIPAGDGAAITGVTDGGCDTVEYGYNLGSSDSPVQGTHTGGGAAGRRRSRPAISRRAACHGPSPSTSSTRPAVMPSTTPTAV